MSTKGLLVGLACAASVGVFLVASTGPGSAAPIAPLSGVQDLAMDQKTTFWGRAFPYRYNWSLVRACTRYVPVETTRGTRMERVWVCRERPRR
jgi:hypothetical protein